MKAVLDKHNVYRCMHGVPLFTWDDAIAANAQAPNSKSKTAKHIQPGVSNKIYVCV